MNIKNLLIFLFLFFGIYAIINPIGISISNLQKSYTVVDLIRGWGIYATTIGALLYDSQKWQVILATCFLISILWHIEIAERNKWPSHHIHSIIINFICWCLVIYHYLFSIYSIKYIFKDFQNNCLTIYEINDEIDFKKQITNFYILNQKNKFILKKISEKC